MLTIWASDSVLQYDFQNSVGHWVCRTAHLFERAMNEELARCDITFRQCQVLAWLAMEGDVSQVELADSMNIEPPTLVRVLDRMERDGLVQRVDCPDDRRRKIVQPLTQAEPVWKKIVECAESVRARAEAGLTPRQIADLNELLGIVQANLGRAETCHKKV